MLKKINSATLAVMRVILCICGTVSSLLILAGAFMRYIMGADFFGMDELVMLSAFWLYFIGSAYASYEDSHISADMIQSFVKNAAVLKTVAIIKYSLATIISAITSYWCIQYLVWNIQMWPKTPVFKIPLVTSQLPIVISFIMMTIYMLMHLVVAARRNDYGKETKAE